MNEMKPFLQPQAQSFRFLKEQLWAKRLIFVVVHVAVLVDMHACSSFWRFDTSVENSHTRLQSPLLSLCLPHIWMTELNR